MRNFKDCKLRLERRKQTIESMYPEYQHDIPFSAEINIGMLSQGGGTTSDTCYTARKLNDY